MALKRASALIAITMLVSTLVTFGASDAASAHGQGTGIDPRLCKPANSAVVLFGRHQDHFWTCSGTYAVNDIGHHFSAGAWSGYVWFEDNGVWRKPFCDGNQFDFNGRNVEKIALSATRTPEC